MFIWKDTRRRANPYAPYTAPDGTRYTRVPSELLEEIPDPTPPEDYSEDIYYYTEQDDAPYGIYTRKSDEQIAAIWWGKIKSQRDELINNGGCLVNGKWFHTDAASKQQQIALLLLGANIPNNLKWKTMDGSFVDMTPSLITTIFAAQIAREQQIFSIAEIAKSTPFMTINWPDRYIKSI